MANHKANRGNPPEPVRMIGSKWERVGEEAVPTQVKRIVADVLRQEQEEGCSCDPEISLHITLRYGFAKHEEGCALHGGQRLIAPRPVSRTIGSAGGR